MGWGQPPSEASRKSQPPHKGSHIHPRKRPQDFEEIIPVREKQSIYDANKQITGLVRKQTLDRNQ